MNKLLLTAFAFVAFSAIHVRWSNGALLDDFVAFPNLRYKRDLEFEEFLKDGDMKAATRRAVERQKRLNEDNMPEAAKRFRRGLLEEDDEEADDDAMKRCVAQEYNNRKRDICFDVTVFNNPIKWKVDHDGCSQLSIDRLIEGMSYYNSETDCFFDLVEELGENADIEITCVWGEGNFAPIGKNPFKKFNVEQPNQKNGQWTAGYKVINHELGHVCGLDHTQKYEGSNQWEDINVGCVEETYLSQFTPYSCGTDLYPADYLSPLSVMQYASTAFIKDDPACTATIDSKCSSLSKDTFNARKEIDLGDVAMIRRAYGKDCPDPSELGPGEVYGSACLVLQFLGDIDAEVQEVSSDDYCIDIQTTTVNAGQIVRLQCPPICKNMVVSSMEWSNIPSSNKCKNDVFRGLASSRGHISDIMFVCGDGEDSVCTHFFEDSTTFYLDARGISQGSASVATSCCECF